MRRALETLGKQRAGRDSLRLGGDPAPRRAPGSAAADGSFHVETRCLHLNEGPRVPGSRREGDPPDQPSV